MSQKLTKMTLIAAMTVSLSGCAQITKLGDNMWGHTKNAWGYTKSAANFVVSPVTNLLRSAPEPEYVFQDAAYAQNMAKQAFYSNGYPYLDEYPAHNQGFISPDLAQLPAPQTPSYQAPVHAPQSYQSAYGHPPAAPSRVAEARPVAPLAAPQPSDDISFVKMGGGSNMQDWLMCEAEAGGFVRVVQGGYLIDPGFESCMRAKGYKPESEVAGLIGTDISL